MKNITEALGDNAKFYPNYMANHLASDFRFHLDNGIGRILDEKLRLTEENAKLRHELANLIYMSENNTGNEPSLSCFHLAIDEAKQLLNQPKDQNNDNMA